MVTWAQSRSAGGLSVKILVVEDERNVVEILRRYLVAEGHTVVSVADGLAALEVFRRERPGFVILDLMLPGLNGIRVCQELRRESDVPILMLTGRTTESDKVVGLTVGADDYVTKPFSPREVVARIEAICRRTDLGRNTTSGKSGPTEAKSDGSAAPGSPARAFPPSGLLVDVPGRRAFLDASELSLTPSEFQILRTMAARPGRVFTRDELLDRLRGDDADIVDRAIDVHMVNLRRKLGDDHRNPRYIRTVRGTGYALGGKRDDPITVWEE